MAAIVAVATMAVLFVEVPLEASEVSVEFEESEVDVREAGAMVVEAKMIPE
jgi:hypothetical protein